MGVERENAKTITQRGKKTFNTLSARKQKKSMGGIWGAERGTWTQIQFKRTHNLGCAMGQGGGKKIGLKKPRKEPFSKDKSKG